jgi:hypothetical protein
MRLKANKGWVARAQVPDLQVAQRAFIKAIM